MIKENGFVLYTSKLGLIHVQNSVPGYGRLLQALLDDNFSEAAFLKMLTETLTCDITELSGGEVTREDDVYTFTAADGEKLELPADIYNKMQELVGKGASYEHLRNFWRRCLCNPRRESIQQLFAFVSRHLLTITDEGMFVTYKAVRANYYDKHSGTFDNHPGLVVTMPRQEVTFDPNTHCAAGLHVSNYDYAHGFANFGAGDRIVVCLVDPADVVSVPHDCSAQKIRVCKYIVQSDYTPSLAFEDTAVVTGNLTQVSDVAHLDVNRPWSSTEDDCIIEFMFDHKDEEPLFSEVASLANALGRTTDGVFARMQRIEDEEDPVNNYDSFDQYMDCNSGEDYDVEDDDDDCEPVCGDCCGCCDCESPEHERASLGVSIIYYVFRNHAENNWSSFSTIKAISEEFEISPEYAHELLTELNDLVLIAEHCSADSYLKAIGQLRQKPAPVKEPWETVTSSVMDEEQLRFLYEQVGVFGYNWKVIQSKMTKAFPGKAVVHEDTLRKTARRMGL
jgi:hypothetical protein